MEGMERKDRKKRTKKSKELTRFERNAQTVGGKKRRTEVAERIVVTVARDEEDVLKHSSGNESSTSESDESDSVEKPMKVVESESEKKKSKKKSKVKSKKKKEDTVNSWYDVAFEGVGFDYQKLNPAAQAAVKKEKQAKGLSYQAPERMWKCRLNHLATSNPGHQSYMASNKTSNLKSHMESFHEECVKFMDKAFAEDKHKKILETSFQDFLNAQKLGFKGTPQHVLGDRNITSFFGGVKRNAFATSLSKSHRQELAFMLWLVEAEDAFAGLDLKSFKTFQREIGANWRSRKPLVDLLRPVYLFVMESRKELLEKAGCFATTFDFWNAFGEDYLGITYSVCTEEFRLLTFVLDLVYCSSKKYSEFVAEQVKQCINSHTEKSVHVSSVTDTCSNVTSASFMLTDDDCKNCINHELNLVIKDCFTGTDKKRPTAPLASELMSFINDVIVWIRTNKAERRLFEKFQMKLSDKVLKMREEHEIRWEGKYRAIERFLSLKKALKALCGEESSVFKESLEKFGKRSSRENIESKTFWNDVKEIEAIMRVFHIISKQAQAEKEVTLSCIPYWIYQMKKACVFKEGEGAACQELKTALLRSIESRLNYYLEENSNVLRCAALDPRMSKLSLWGVSEEVEAAVWEEVVNEQLVFLESDAEHLKPLKTTILKAQLEEVKVILKEFSNTFYENGDGLAGLDPLEFWRRATSKDSPSCPPDSAYSRISRNNFASFFAFMDCARMLFCIPAGSSPSEREFSSSGRVYTKIRNQLSEDVLEMIVVIRDFIKSQDFNFEELCVYLAKKLQDERDVD
jgi:hAT family C-terminal dimerisation region